MSVVCFCVKDISVWKIELSYCVEQNMFLPEFSLKLEYSFGKISSPDIKTFTFLYWAEWNNEKNDTAKPRKPKLKILGDYGLYQNISISQKYKNSKHALTYHKSEVSFIGFIAFLWTDTNSNAQWMNR